MAYLIGPGSAHGVGAHILRLFQTPNPPDYAGIQWAAVRHELESIKARALPAIKADTTAYEGIYESPVMGRVEIKADADGVLSFTLGPRATLVRFIPLAPRLFKAEVQLPSDEGPSMTLSGEALFATNREDRPISFQLDTMDSTGQPSFTRIEKP